MIVEGCGGGPMADRKRWWFAGSAVLLALAGTAVVAIGGPPDAGTQLSLVAAAAAIALGISYLLVYRLGLIDR